MEEEIYVEIYCEFQAFNHLRISIIRIMNRADVAYSIQWFTIVD